MKKNSSRLGEQGFVMFALMASVTVVFMATAYVANHTQATQQSLRSGERALAHSATELTNLSNLGRVKALMAMGQSGAMTPALYPLDYFAETWKLAKNVTPGRPLPFVETMENQIWLPSYAAGGLTSAKAVKVFEGTQSQTDLLTEAQNITISANIPDEDHPFYIRSIEIKTVRPIDLRGEQGGRDVETVGRIDLPAPLPTGMRLLVKFPGEGDFRSDWASRPGPHPAGEYAFQLHASGIVHYGELKLGDQVFSLGINPETNEILHRAVNIKADDVIIGEITQSLGTPADFDDASIKFEECRVDVVPVAGQGSGTAVAISARVYSVTGDGMNDLAVLDHYLGIAGSNAAVASNPGLGCEQKCPYEFKNDFWLDPLTQARFLDLTVTGESDTTKLDYFEPEISALITTDARGVICSNMELVGQAMTNEGGKVPTEIFSTDRTAYEDLRNKNMKLKRFFAYTAPSCKRQLVGQRTECGCFAEDTLIKMGDGREARIQDIRAGDQVWNPKSGQVQSVKRVIAGPEKLPMHKISTGSESVVVTHQHPFLVGPFTVSADQLKVGDAISTGASGAVKTVTAIEVIPWDESTPAPVVWNLELEGSEEFSDHYVIANGIMTGDLFIQEASAKK